MSELLLRDQLGIIIKRDGMVSRDKSIILSGGGKSNIYYDMRKVLAQPYALSIAAKLCTPVVRQYKANSVGGMESSAIGLASAISLATNTNTKPRINWFYVRKSRREHGLEEMIEGSLIKPAVIVDDVLTTGKSIMSCIERIEEQGCSIAGVVVIIDRLNICKGGSSDLQLMLRQKSIKFMSLFNETYFNAESV